MTNIQIDLQTVFERLKAILQEYTPPLVVHINQQGNYSLDAPKPSKKRAELFFGAVTTKKEYVGYYLMPVYCYPELLEDLPLSLWKRKQGKSCFNFKKIDEELFAQLSELTRQSFEKYKEEGMI